MGRQKYEFRGPKRKERPRKDWVLANQLGRCGLGIPVRTGPPYIYVRRRDPGPARPRSAPSTADPTDTRAHAPLS